MPGWQAGKPISVVLWKVFPSYLEKLSDRIGFFISFLMWVGYLYIKLYRKIP